MTLDPNKLKIKDVSVATIEQAKQFAKNAKGGAEYVQEVFNLYPATGYSPEVVVAQWAVETGVGQSPAWTGRYNPAGIGITDGGDVGLSFKSPTDAARVQEVHLSAYVDGYSRGVRRWLDLDPRYLLVLKTDWGASVQVVNDLTGKWATDPQYGVKIAGRIEELRGVRVVQPPTGGVGDGKLTFGRVPRPLIVDRVIPDANNIAWDNLGPRSVYGIVYHRQLGNNWGTDGWFRTMWQSNGQPGGGQLGLTDFGVDRNSGEILKWNDPHGVASRGVSANRSPYASGGSGGRSGDGVAFVNKYGSVAINRNLSALEIDGNYDDAIGAKGYKAIVAWSAYMADGARIPYLDYPMNPATGLVFTYWHNEFQREKPCPGKVVMDLTPQIVADTKALLKQYQLG